MNTEENGKHMQQQEQTKNSAIAKTFCRGLVLSTILLLISNIGVTQSIQTIEEIESNKKNHIRKLIQFSTRIPGGTTQGDTLLVKEFNKDGQITRQANYYYNRVNSEIRYEYKNGLLASNSSFYNNRMNQQTRYEYDDKGRLKKETWYSVNTQPTGSKSYQYDKKGNRISTKQYGPNNQVQYAEYFRYNSNNQEIYRATTNYRGDTNFREHKKWKGNLLVESKYDYQNQYSNSTTSYEYDSRGRKTRQLTKGYYNTTDITYKLNQDGNVILTTQTHQYQNGYNNQLTLTKSVYKDGVVTQNTYYSNNQSMRRNTSYIYRDDELVEIREMNGGSYGRSTKFEEFISSGLKIRYNYNYTTAAIDEVEESYRDKTGRISKRILFKPDYKLTNIFDLKRPKQYTEELFTYSDDGRTLDIYSRTHGWDGLTEACGNKNNRKKPSKICDTIKTEVKGNQTIKHLALNWGGIRKVFYNSLGEMDSVLDCTFDGSVKYRFIRIAGSKYTVYHKEQHAFNEQDSLIRKYELTGGVESPKWELTYTAQFEGKNKQSTQFYSSGKLSKEVTFNYHKDSIVEVVKLLKEKEGKTIVHELQDGRVVKSKTKSIDELPGEEWIYTYDQAGRLTYKSQLSLNAYQEDNFVYVRYE